MRITCPYCHSDARLTPNPDHERQVSLPVYRLDCTGCSRTAVRRDNQGLLVAALVGKRHGNGDHELTVSARQTGHTSFHTDPSGRSAPALGYCELLEYVTRQISAHDTFSLLLSTSEVGSRYPSVYGGIPYRALRGWVIIDGEIRALTGQQVWEASCRDAPVDELPELEAGFHYVDADAIPRPYPW